MGSEALLGGGWVGCHMNKAAGAAITGTVLDTVVT